MPVDLHSHSTASDGSFTPTELARAFADFGIRVAGLADHDTVGGVDEFLKACDEAGIVGVGGIEFSTVHRDLEVHFLGYGLPFDDPRFIEYLQRHADYLKARAEETLRKLASYGYRLDLEEVYRISDGNPPMPPHILRALSELGVFSDLGGAISFFWDYLATDEKAWVPHETSLERVIGELNEVGALAIVAHPLRLPDLHFLEEIMDMGADGFELYYPEQIGDLFSDLQVLAIKRDCVVTGGCDYHGAFAERRIGEVEIPIEIAEGFFRALGEELPVSVTRGEGGVV